MGFLVLTILFLVLGIAYEPIKKTSIILFIVIFTLMQFFLNFGPNATTFVIPGIFHLAIFYLRKKINVKKFFSGEVFPTRYRSTAHGISAALGKLGAIVSQGFEYNYIFGTN